MATIAKMRRAYFALLRELPGIEHGDRHDLQERLTGKRSTRDWLAADWDTAVAALQRLAGQHEDRHAHVRTERPHGVAAEGGEFATWAQCATIEDVCDGIEWHLGCDEGRSAGTRRALGPLAYVCRHFLLDDRWALLRERVKRAASRGSKYRGGQWRCLPREVAGDLIRALIAMRCNYPREEADHARADRA